jgi:hypothetical protein
MPYFGNNPSPLLLNTLAQNGKELTLDADADTSITADTDDQIDIKIGGADDFQFTANTFTAQSGSTIAAQALTATTITASGIVKTDDATDATSTTDGSLQTDGGLSVAKDAVIGNDLLMKSDSSAIKFGADSEMILTHVHNEGLKLMQSAAAGGLLTLGTTSTSVSDGAFIGGIDFASGSGPTVNARVHGKQEGTSENGGRVSFETRQADGSLTEKMRLEGAGRLFLNTNNIDEIIEVKSSKDGSGTGFIRIDANATSYSASTRAIVADFSGTAHSSAQIGFQLEGSAGVKGSIVSTGNTTCSFVDTSDERLKTDIEDLTDGLTTINKIRPRKFKWISEGEDAEYDHGFIAQELYEDYKCRVVRVGGEDPKTDPWSVGVSKLVPMLVKALQEADAKIEALTLRVKTLEDA